MARSLRWTEEVHDAWKRREAKREADRPSLKLTPTEIPEAQVLRDVIKALDMHPAVAWVARMNSGVVMIGDGPRKRPFRAAFPGCSDVLGQMADGRFLAVECKRVGGRLTDDQAAFLERVRRSGGVAFVAFGVDDVLRELA